MDILQYPPEVESGTLIFPVLVSVINIFCERKDPSTSPVSTFMVISFASQFSKTTSPVDLSILKLSYAITSLIKSFPVSPFDVILFAFNPSRVVFPVLTERLISSEAVAQDKEISPVSVVK